MNKTFKIVFNKARGALMVANEITGSVQKKGTKLFVASAAVAVCCTAGAATYSDGLNLESSNAVYGNDNDDILITATTSTSPTIFAYDNANLTIKGNSITINTPTEGVRAEKNSTITLGNSNTENISIVAGGNNILDVGVLSMLSGSVVDITTKTLTVTSNGWFGIHVQNNNENGTAPADAATININAENTIVTGNVQVGLSAFSHGQLNVNSNLIVNAINAIDARGNSTININTKEKHTTKLSGDIVFETPNSPGDAQNSGKIINANVNVVLTGNDSFWKGRSYQEYKINGNYEHLVGLEGDASYHGNVTGFNLTIEDGANWTLTDDSFANTLTLRGGTVDATNAAILNVGTYKDGKTSTGFHIIGTGNKLILGNTTKLGGNIVVEKGAELETPLNTAYNGATIATDTRTLVLDPKIEGRLNFENSNEGTLLISDKFTYTGTDLTSLSNIYKGQVGLNFSNATLALEDNVTIDTPVTTGTIAGNKNVNISEGGSLTLSGNNETSDINIATLTNGATLSANNGTTVKIDTLSGVGTVTVGEHGGTKAHMSVNKLDMDGGSIFVDPYYGESTLAVALLNNGELNTNVTAGTRALVTIGTDVASAKNAVAKLDGFDSVESLVYVGTPMTLSETGSIVIDPDAERESLDHPQSVYVANGGALVIDQAAIGSDTVFSGASVKFHNGGKLGITNANVGIITLTDAVAATDTAAGVSDLSDSDITTDNPFVEAAVDGNTIVNTMSAEGGLGALASTGIQAMTRRADTVLAQTIADRTSVDQELAAGTNLWVDVTGERYEADKLDNGGEFKSDMGYGAFGADFAVTQDITAGAAFQYGKGSLRSGVSSIKNSIDSYGVTAYGAMKFGEAKVVAEASYIKNENDITSSQTALNQSVDSEIYSVGVRGQHRFTAGNFQFVPSVGVRVSRLNTDAMQVGAVNIKKQEQTLVQVPIALRVNGFEQNVSGWSVAPSFKIAYVPTFGDKEISVFGADQTVIDTSPVQGDFGIRAQNGNLMVNANMMLGGGKDGTSSVGGKVGLKYVF